MRLKTNAVTLTASIGAGLILSAASSPAQDHNDMNPARGGNLAGAYNPVDSLQFWLCILSVGLGLFVLAGQYMLLRRLTHITSDDIIKNSAITIVIIAAVVLIIAGYNSQQTAQAFGLFGTIIGYLLGRSAGKREAEQDRAQERE
jgi:Na+/proline symporter